MQRVLKFADMPTVYLHSVVHMSWLLLGNNVLHVIGTLKNGYIARERILQQHCATSCPCDLLTSAHFLIQCIFVEWSVGITATLAISL